MRRIIYALVVSACVLLAGCGGSYNVTRTAAKAPEQIRTISFSSQDGNSPEVTGYVSEALTGQGVVIKPVSTAKAFKSAEVDAIVSYSDVWRWDLMMYLKSISINLYNASTGELLATGRWGDSLLHGYHRGESVTKELINEMFSKLDLKQGLAKEGNGVSVSSSGNIKSATEGLASEKIFPSQNAPSTSPNGLSVSRNEYEARQMARTLNCRSQAILAIEGVGSPREQITFDCGEGQKITIICRTGSGCS